MKSTLEDLKKEFEWLVLNRAVRIKFMSCPETFERLHKNTIFAYAHKKTEEYLKADVEILKDRINGIRNSYGHKYFKA